MNAGEGKSVKLRGRFSFSGERFIIFIALNGVRLAHRG